MPEELKNEVRKILELGIKFLKEDGRTPPMAFLYTDHGNLCVDKLDFSNKPKMMKNLRLISKESEAYMVIVMSDIFMGDLYGPRPSQSPNKRRAMFIYGENKHNNYGIAQEYKTDKTNKVKLGGKTIFDIDQMEGPMTGILK